MVATGEDEYLVVQLFSYPGDYVAQRPSIERLAETLTKFEGDVLGAPAAMALGLRRATLVFGEPVPVAVGDRKKGAAAELTRTLEARVQSLLDGIQAPAGRSFCPASAIAPEHPLSAA